MSRKSKRSKRNKRRFLMLIIIVLVIFIMIKINKDEEEIILSDELNKSYVKEITNNTNSEIKSEYQDIIIKYLDLYTDSLVNLKARDVTKLFTDNNSAEAYLTQTTINTQVFHHKSQLNDMKLSNAYYNIEFTNIKEKNNKITITFLENDYYNFKYLGNITSRLIDIINTIVLNNNNGKYTIDSIRIDRDNYVIFTNVLDKNFTIKDIDTLNNKYLGYIEKEVEKNKKNLEYANSHEYIQSKSCDHKYNRDRALEYSYKYVDSRNDEYLDYSNLGGNCANYASQAIHDGGIPMDYDGLDQWKYYSDELNEDEVKRGRSSSWVSTYYFYKYAKNNTGFGMCAEVDINLFYAQIGDVIHVGYKDDTYSHTTFVSKVIKKDNKVVDILINSNTTGLKDYPVLGYIYLNKRLIKILGYND